MSKIIKYIVPMGMDIYGKKPISEEGEYFQANIWAWRTIQVLLKELCYGLIDSDSLAAMSFNEGAGVTEQHVCNEIANRFEKWLTRHPEGHQVEAYLRVREDNLLVFSSDLTPSELAKTRTPYQLTSEHLREWISFLRACGGFEVC